MSRSDIGALMRYSVPTAILRLSCRCSSPPPAFRGHSTNRSVRPRHIRRKRRQCALRSHRAGIRRRPASGQGEGSYTVSLLFGKVRYFGPARNVV